MDSTRISSHNNLFIINNVLMDTNDIIIKIFNIYLILLLYTSCTLLEDACRQPLSQHTSGFQEQYYNAYISV